MIEQADGHSMAMRHVTDGNPCWCKPVSRGGVWHHRTLGKELEEIALGQIAQNCSDQISLMRYVDMMRNWLYFFEADHRQTKS